MVQGLVYGWRSAILSVAFAQLLLLAIALLRPIQNRIANRILAVLLVVLAGVITPWMIGFAGFYDRWQWLSFAPFAISLAIAPLTYFYVVSLTTGRLPQRTWFHLAPAVVQFTYLAGAFLLLRQPFKNDWLTQSSPTHDLIVNLGVVLGLGTYGGLCRSLIGQYRTRLIRQRSDTHRLMLGWLSRAVAALFVLLAIWATYGIWDLIRPLGYFGLMGLYAAIAAFALFLGIEGWRHSTVPFPTLAELQISEPGTTDWSGKAGEWAGRIIRERIFADPELSVPKLAKILGTNTSYVSRAFNDGLGESFSAYVNRLRCEDVAERLRQGSAGDLLDLALESGFSSKASFNRAFKATFGASPSAYRQAHGSSRK
ncbi:helix-turn-helix domain-containing protein [Novosphingobium sp. Gsoil 351]|uniref:helix-turn-helix domain-containing protein n=1 Tax=Novosphingobium sp. Gsoil 351 TaxID=2675225 RepID=UPI0012B47F27|nr:helix-turn-helix domain-containing protein [Novosphingobium sp. Gsoil 351]QGN55008.1 helix-turn-helix domain-containing protein [Novosphingobium sp. Gsoil 351]